MPDQERYLSRKKLKKLKESGNYSPKDMKRRAKENIAHEHSQTRNPIRRWDLKKSNESLDKSGREVVVGLLVTGAMLAALGGFGGARAEASPRAPQLDQKPGISRVDATSQPTIPLPRGRALLSR